MSALPLSIVFVIAVLTVFLSLTVGLKYAIQNEFTRTRLSMTAFFFFIVATLTLSFSRYALATLPFTIPALLAGIGLGYLIGVRTEQQKIAMEGISYYMSHFAHIHFSDFTHLSWWSFINFYSVMGALALINLVGLTNVIFQGAETFAIVSSVFGALMIGSIVPYLVHLWTIGSSESTTQSS